MFDLVSFSKDNTEFVKNFRLLVEVWRHLQDCDQSTNSMIIGFKFLVEDTDTVPELRVFDIFQRVKSMLVSIERFLKIFNQKVAMTKSSPCWTVVWVNTCELEIVLNCVLVLTVSRTVFSELVKVAYIHHVWIVCKSISWILGTHTSNIRLPWSVLSLLLLKLKIFLSLKSSSSEACSD